MPIRIFLLLATMLFTACTTKEPPHTVAPKAVPSWYTHPPQNDARWLYATGEGVDRQSAITHALNALASGISVTIASQYRSDATLNRTGKQEEGRFQSTSTIQADVEKIRISQFDVLEGKEQSFRRYIVLLRAEKRRIAEGIQNELDTAYAQLRNRQNVLANESVLTRYLFYRDIQKTRRQRANSLRILKTLSPAINTQPYLTTEQALETQYLALGQHLCFNLHADTPLGEKLIPVLHEGLNGVQLRTGNDQNRCMAVRIATRENRAMSMGLYLARTAIAIETHDTQGNIQASRTLHIVGQASQGYAVAESNVAIKLKKTIQREGIFAVMGLND